MKGRKKRDFPVLLVVLIIALGTMLIPAKQTEEDESQQLTNVVTSRASSSVIPMSISYHGVLEETEGKTMYYPEGIVVKEWYKKDGDIISVGDKLASVDKNSVMTVIARINEKMSVLDQTVETEKLSHYSSYINMPVNGRVKVIHAEQNESVIDVISEHGALAVISTDGLMYVEIPGDGLSKGTEVIVSGLADYKGTVYETKEDSLIITVSDEAPEYNEEVAVKDLSGNTLGTGTLLIHKPVNLCGAGGTISGIFTKPNSYVRKGSEIFGITQNNYRAGYEELLQYRDKLTALNDTLFTIYDSGYIYAEVAGRIEDLNEDVLASSDTNKEIDASYPTTKELLYSGITDIETLYTYTETAFYKIIPVNTGEISLMIDEADISMIHKGDSVDIEFDAMRNEQFSGIVSDIDIKSTNVNGGAKYEVIIDFDLSGEVMMGMGATVSSKPISYTPSLTLPVAAIQRDENGNFVYLSYETVNETFGEKQYIRTGISDGINVEIISGLAENTAVFYEYSKSA